jgi:hypothetical protein
MTTLVTFELSKLLKEKGFDLATRKYYEHSLTERYNSEDGYSGPFGWKKGETILQEGYHINNSKFDNSNDDWFICSTLTISEVVMWLYGKHGIWIEVSCHTVLDEKDDTIEVDLFYFVARKLKPVEILYSGDFVNSPTEAYEAAIEYTLNNLI